MKKYKCHGCSKRFKTLKEAVNHRRNNKYCDNINENTYKLINKFLETPNTRICNHYCGYTGRDVSKHRQMFHGDDRKYYICHICDIKYTTLLGLKNHLNSHMVDAIVIDREEKIMLMGHEISIP